MEEFLELFHDILASIHNLLVFAVHSFGFEVTRGC
jgi:hypothetical protein